MKIAVINGPNINMLGIREKETYGSDNLQNIMAMLEKEAKAHQIELIFKQSNHEGELVEFIQSLLNKVNFIIINPAAFTHTSVALRDALLAVAIPLIEVHISNVHKREPFRKVSYVSDIAEGVICGFGVEGYRFALQYAIKKLNPAG